MSEALVGVLIGGLIGWIAPLMTLRFSERRWRFETKLEHLKSERQRFAIQYEGALALFADGAVKNQYSSNMIADFLVMFPSEITQMFEAHMKNEDKSDSRVRGTYLEIAAAMRRDLRARDKVIDEYLTGAK